MRTVGSAAKARGSESRRATLPDKKNANRQKVCIELWSQMERATMPNFGSQIKPVLYLFGALPACAQVKTPQGGDSTLAILQSYRLLRRVSRKLHAFTNDKLKQIGDTAAITPFVVVPAHELEEALTEFDAGTFVVNR